MCYASFEVKFVLCPLCKTKMTASVELTGGCGVFGHPDGEPCYCDSPDVHVEFHCPKAVAGEYKQGKWVKNKNVCKQPPLKVGELSDQRSVARWLTENYVPGPNANIFAKK